jgi:hypothetical protein
MSDLPDEDLLATLLSDLKSESYFLRVDASRATNPLEKAELEEAADLKIKEAKALFRLLKKIGIPRLGRVEDQFER